MTQNASKAEAKEQLGPALVPILHVGLKDVPGAVACLHENVIAYVTGKCVATHSNVPGKVCVSEPCRDVRSITAMAASRDRKWIAIAETTAGTRPPQVSILDVEHGLERLHVKLQGPSADRYHNLEFSADGKLLVACSQLSDDQTSVFHVWEWQTSLEPSSSGTVSGKAVKATINPKFPANVVVQSRNDLAYLRLGSAGYRQHPLDGLKKQATDKATFVDHTWLADGQLVVAMSNRRLLIMEGVEVQAVVPLQRMPTCLAAMADGCLLVGTTNGCIELHRPDNQEGNTGCYLALQATLMMPDSGLGGGVMGSSECSITQMSLEPGSERVVCYIKFGPVFMLNTRLAKTSSFRNNMATAEAMWEQLLPGMHAGSIVSASMAVRKELVATASDDLTVRVWGIRPLRLVATHLCHHLPLAVAMDPGASELVVAYVDCVRLYSVVEGMLLEVGGLYLPSRVESKAGSAEVKDSTPSRELSKVSIVSYSPTGHLLALVGGVANKEVLVFSALHRSLLARLTGHYSTVQDLAWSDDGLYLCTVSDGAVYTWHMEGFRRLQEDTTKGHNNNCVACTPDFGHLIVGESLQGLRMLSTSRAVQPLSPEKGEDMSVGDPQDAAKPGIRPGPIVRPGAGGNPTRRAESSPLKGTNLNAPAGLEAETSFMSNGFRFPATGKHAAASSPRPMGQMQGRKAGGDTELEETVSSQPVALPIRSGLVVCITPEYQAVVCAGAMGCLRVVQLPLRSQHHYQEYTVHSADITVLRAHFKGRLVLSGDAAGSWVLHQLLPPDQYKNLPLTSRQGISRVPSVHMEPERDLSPRPAQRTARGHLIGLPASLTVQGSAGEDDELGTIVGRGMVMSPLPPYSRLAELARSVASVKVVDGQDGSYDVLTVRAVDMHILQDSLREAREQLAKSATAADYKAYEREQQIRRAVDEEVGQCRQKMEEAEALVQQVRAAAEAEAKAARSNIEALRAQHQADLEAEHDKLESRLASEITRTNASENEVQRIKAKFGKKLYDVESSHKRETELSQNRIVTLKNQMAKIQKDAQASISKANEQMGTEMRLGHEIAEEEVSRIQDYSQGQVEERDERYLRLLAKHTLETGLSSKTAAENEQLKATNEQLTLDHAKLTEQVRGLSDELHAMHAAWADRDVKQRLQDAELKEVSRQASQGHMYTGLATDRIKALSEEIESLQKAKKDSETLAQNLEGAQVRQAEKHIKFQREHDKLKARVQYLQSELNRVKLHAKQRDEYFDNFANQLYRVVHNVNPDEWAQLFGRLHADFVAGKDNLDWGSYRSPAAQSSPVDRVLRKERKAGAQERTVEELKTQLREMHAQVMHSERMMNLTRDTCEKERAGYKGLVSRMQADNMQVLAQLNEAKRELKEAQEDADISRSEAHTIRIMSRSSTHTHGSLKPAPSIHSAGSTIHSAGPTATAASPKKPPNAATMAAALQPPPSPTSPSAAAAAVAVAGSFASTPQTLEAEKGAAGSLGISAWGVPPTPTAAAAAGEKEGLRASPTHAHLAAAVRLQRGHSASGDGDTKPATGASEGLEGPAGARPGTSPQTARGPLISRFGSAALPLGTSAPPTVSLDGTSANDASVAGQQDADNSAFPSSRQAGSRPTTSLSSALFSPALTRPSTSTVNGDMPQGGWWLEQNNLFNPASSMGVMRHLDALKPKPKAKQHPTAGIHKGSTSRGGGSRSSLDQGPSRASWSRGSLGGPSPPLAPCTPVGVPGTRGGLAHNLDIFVPFFQAPAAESGAASTQQQRQSSQQQLMLQHQLHQFHMQQQQQHLGTGGASARNTPSWRPGVPTAEVYTSYPPPSSASSAAAVAGSLSGLRSLIGSRQGQAPQPPVAYGPGVTSLGLSVALATGSHASSPHARPRSSSPPDEIPLPGVTANASTTHAGTGQVYVAVPGGGIHSIVQGPQHQQQQQKQATSDGGGGGGGGVASAAATSSISAASPAPPPSKQQPLGQLRKGCTQARTSGQPTLPSARTKQGGSGNSGLRERQDSEPGEQLGPWSLEANPAAILVSPRVASASDPQPIMQPSARSNQPHHAVPGGVHKDTSASGHAATHQPQGQQQEQPQHHPPPQPVQPLQQHPQAQRQQQPQTQQQQQAHAHQQQQPQAQQQQQQAHAHQQQQPQAQQQQQTHAHQQQQAHAPQPESGQHSHSQPQSPHPHHQPGSDLPISTASNKHTAAEDGSSEICGTTRPHTSGPAPGTNLQHSPFQLTSAAASPSQPPRPNASIGPPRSAYPPPSPMVVPPRPYTSYASPSMAGVGGPSGFAHPHSNTAPRLNTMGGGFRSFVPRQPKSSNLISVEGASTSSNVHKSSSMGRTSSPETARLHSAPFAQ